MADTAAEVGDTADTTETTPDTSDGTPDATADTDIDAAEAEVETEVDAADASDATDAADAEGDTAEEPWDFDPATLREGARSDIPDAIMNAWPALLGGQMTRHSAITGIEFHIPGVISSEGMSPTPIPVRKTINGVEHWQVTGELSSRNQDDWGIYYAIGPIDERGVNHRAEPFDPFEPTEDNPDDAASHPRAGLPGAIFTVRWPVAGFNGGVIQMQPAADAGHGYPQALMAWWPVDPLVLMDRGYAVASVAAGGTVYARNTEGAWVVDTNPESGSDIFFTVDFGLWPDNGIYETEDTKLVSTLRAMKVDPVTFAETPYPAVTEVELVFPYFNGESGLVEQERFVENLTDPGLSFPIAFYGVELISDSVVVFKNLLRQATGTDAIWAAYLGWSGSGHSGWSIATGTQSSGAFQFDKALGVPPSGGNFNTWKDPTSGRRFDAFLIYGSARPNPFFRDLDTFEELAGSPRVDPDYPLSAPYVFVRGEADVITGDFGDNFWANSTLMANAVARAWPTSQLADASLDAYLAIYEVEKLTHQVRDQLFTNWDRAPFDVHARWYDPALGATPEAMNSERRGLRMTEVYARQNVVYEVDDIEGFANVLHVMPRLTPLFVSLFSSLRSTSESGVSLPTSRVGPHFASLDAVDATTLVPRYPAPCELTDASTEEDFAACIAGLEGDASRFQSTLYDFEIAAVHAFISDNPLTRSTESIVVPDIAAPLGWFFINYGANQLRRDFDAAELAARYVDHAGYVAAFRAATEALVAQGLWDAVTGQLYIDDAEASDVLAP